MNYYHLDGLTDDILQKKLLSYDVMVMPYYSEVDNQITEVPAKLFQYLGASLLKDSFFSCQK